MLIEQQIKIKVNNRFSYVHVVVPLTGIYPVVQLRSIATILDVLRSVIKVYGFYSSFYEALFYITKRNVPNCTL